jgi:four helix bundle protein
MELERRKPRDIRERCFAFAVMAVKLYRKLLARTDRSGWAIGRQFLDAATSVGANEEEAQAAESKNDFIHKNKVALKEAREALYWLKLMSAAAILPAEELAPLIREADEIVSVITAIIVSAKGGVRR